MWRNIKYFIDKKQDMSKNDNVNVCDDDKIIDIDEENMEIRILKDIQINELYDTEETNIFTKINFPINFLFTSGGNLLSTTVFSQTINYCAFDNYVYFVVKCDNKLRVVEQEKVNDEINQIELIIDCFENTFKLTIAKHDKYFSTKGIKTYPSSEIFNEEFCIDRIKAFETIKDLIKRIDSKLLLRKMINVSSICRCCNIINLDRYYPVATNGIISLSPRHISELNLNTEVGRIFDIVLNDTLENIGEISLNLSLFKSSYSGNVSYLIKKDYQNKHYGTEALKLLIDIIKNFPCNFDKTLFIFTKKDNYASQKVAINCGGDICYEGEVPEDNSLNYIDGVKEVKIYQIKID